MAEIPVRHRLRVEAFFTDNENQAWCTCGRSWADPADGLKHVKAARRWHYLGIEEHYDEKYHMWEHALTSRRYAWLVERYEKDTRNV